jgi:hypothetical protein
MSRRLAATVFISVSVAVGIAACGGDSDDGGSDDPAAVTENFFNAVADGDGETACGLLSEDGLSNIPESPDTCVDEVSQLSDEERARFTPSDVAQVTGDTEHCGTISESDTDAETVATVNGDVQCINLSLVDGEWKINDT